MGHKKDKPKKQPSLVRELVTVVGTALILSILVRTFLIQAFYVPIRDIETHRPLPGIEIGDIGPKFGFIAKDNGYCIFNKVRIPRRNMLMRYVNIDKEGQINLQGNPKVLYSVMMFTRLQLLS